MAKTKAKTTRHLPRMGFGAPTVTPKLIVRDMSKSVRNLGTNTPDYVEELRAIWDRDYSLRTRPFFAEERMYLLDSDELKIIDPKDIVKGNSNHTVQEHLFMACCSGWMLKIVRQLDGQIDFDFSVFNGSGMVFHPDEARNQILAHHSPEVYDRWRKHVRKTFAVCAPQLIAACKEAMPNLRAWSVTCCDSSERLMRSLDDVIVRDKIAYLVW